MHLKSQTPLESCAVISAALRQKLKPLWVESVEELISLVEGQGLEHVVTALDSSGILTPTAMETVRGMVASSRMAQLQPPQSLRVLGCRLDPRLIEAFGETTRVRKERRIPPQAQRLPPAVRLFERLHPCKNQGERGTCVAYASVALREFLAGNGARFSEQFLYWACKELDGIAGPGTFVSTAMSALATYGVCTDAAWPYNPHGGADEGQGPPPAGAEKEALLHRMVNARTVESSLVGHYKAILAGDDITPGMPVVIATYVFNSWFRSAEAHRTGKITLPLPGERPLDGGHAWCIVGYVDDVSVPGGGYFIVRNSWGTEWAADSPEAAGHALMPFEYVQCYCVESFTGPSLAKVSPGSSDGLSVYRRKLDADLRDVEDRLIPAGNWVLAHPDARDDVVEDTEANRRRFRQMDFTCTPAHRIKVWFSSPSIESLRTTLSAALPLRDHFLGELDLNWADAKDGIRGQPFPSRAAPFWYSLLPWEPTVSRVEHLGEESLTDALVARLQTPQHSRVPAEVAWPSSVQKRLHECSSLSVYRLWSGSTAIDIVVGFITPIQCDGPGKYRLVTADSVHLEDVRAVYRDWLAGQRQIKPAATYFTVGTPMGWGDGLVGTADSEGWTLLSSPGEEPQSWKTVGPRRQGDRLVLRDFLDRLLPVSHKARASRIRTLVDEHVGSRGAISDKFIKERLGYRHSEILRVFDEMVRENGYHWAQINGRVAIGRESLGIKNPSEKIFSHVPWKLVISSSILVVPNLIGAFMNWWALGTPAKWSAVAVSIVSAYVSTLVIKWLNHLSRSED